MEKPEKHHFEGAGPPIAAAPGRHLQPESADSSTFSSAFSTHITAPTGIKTVFFTTGTWWPLPGTASLRQPPFTEKTRRVKQPGGKGRL